MTAEEYAQGVRDGKIVCGELVKAAVERYYRDMENRIEHGWHFDRQSALRAIRYIESLRQTKGKWAGQSLELEGWQKFIEWNIFGWKNADGTRRFHYAYIEVARKNGKTTLAAGNALYMLHADGEPRAEVYSVAATRDQAKICFDDAVNIVNGCALKKRLRPMAHSIVYDPAASFFKPLSSDAGIQDGLSPHCSIVDEYHAHPTSAMYDVMRSGQGARSQPLMFIITTAGFNKHYPCYAYRKNAINVAKGIVEDDSLFVMIFTRDDEDDWDDEENWIKSNPNLGVSVSLEYLREQAADAKNRPEAVRNVKTKNFNEWVDAELTWILDEKWMECVGDTPVEELRHKQCWGGLDLSNVSDMTAYVLLFRENGKYQVLPFFWIPEETLLKKIKESNVNFQEWVDRGFIRVTPGNVTDYNYVKADILAINEEYDVQTTAYDRWNSSQAVIDLQNEGLEMDPFGQGYGSMSTPTKELEKIVLTGELEHFGNPVLRWMMAAVAIATDPAGNIKCDKRKSSQKIDGVVAMIMALGEYLTWLASQDASPYVERGLRSLD